MKVMAIVQLAILAISVLAVFLGALTRQVESLAFAMVLPILGVPASVGISGVTWVMRWTERRRDPKPDEVTSTPVVFIYLTPIVIVSVVIAAGSFCNSLSPPSFH